MRHRNIHILAVTCALTMAGAAPLAAADLKVSGAAAVANTVIMPNKAAIEAGTGLTLAVTVNGDGNGLKDLVAGKSDVMMVAAPIAATEAAINAVAPGSISAAGIEMQPVGAIAIRFIVHPSNPIKPTEEQLKLILLGKLTNWKELGGADQPILVVAEMPGFGTRTNIVTSFLGGEEITSSARLVQAMVQVAQVVAQAPAALGYGNAGSITPAVTVVPDITVQQPIGFATKGPAGADAQRLIEAARIFGAAVK